MARSDRLLELIQFLRTRRHPVKGAQLADEFGVSLRTIYRDIQGLIAKGAPIDGEPGVGYVLRPGFTMPPLMFSTDEIEAIVLGSRMVARSADANLSKAALNAVAKIAAVLPVHRGAEIDAPGLHAGAIRATTQDSVDMAPIRSAIRMERKISISYCDEAGAPTERTIWPISLTFCATVRLLAAWCELRGGYRTFRTDRISAFADTAERYPRRRAVLIREWREIAGLPEPG
ncbi:YafY family protein [Bradyrhizobium sp. 27S5]|uniref:helix-turn-helix transcriptional regulator n=1 Tax=Bradyrhizobium sp. 27S5 TaxID=3139728 RepID=UPI0030D150C7